MASTTTSNRKRPWSEKRWPNYQLTPKTSNNLSTCNNSINRRTAASPSDSQPGPPSPSTASTAAMADRDQRRFSRTKPSPSATSASLKPRPPAKSSPNCRPTYSVTPPASKSSTRVPWTLPKLPSTPPTPNLYARPSRPPKVSRPFSFPPWEAAFPTTSSPKPSASQPSSSPTPTPT